MASGLPDRIVKRRGVLLMMSVFALLVLGVFVSDPVPAEAVEVETETGVGTVAAAGMGIGEELPLKMRTGQKIGGEIEAGDEMVRVPD